MNPEELLAHADFVQSLAHSLVYDEHRARDVAQETWMAAIKHPPAGDRPARAWLAKVARNAARIMYRSEKSRERREQAAARREPPPTPEEIAAREEVRRKMIDAVLELNDPYRSTILMRYYQDRSVKEIAEEMDVPIPTVKSRLKRGLEQLRLRLDNEHDGNRKAWCVALAPIAGFCLERSTVSAYAPALIAMAAVLCIGVPVLLWQMFFSSTATPLPQPDTVGVETIEEAIKPAHGKKESTDIASEPGVIVREEISPSGEQAEETVANDAESYIEWSGSLIDYNGQPLEDKKIELRGDHISSSLITKSAQEGKFLFHELVPGTYTVLLNTDRYREDNRGFFEWGTIKFDSPGNVRKDILLPGKFAVVSGVVIDGTTGTPYRWERKVDPETGKYDLLGGCDVVLSNQEIISGSGTGYSCMVDRQKGTFCLRGIPPGSHDLYLNGPGTHQKYRSIRVAEEGQIIDDIRFTLPPMGKLHVVLSGFDASQFKPRRGKGIEIAVTPAAGVYEFGVPVYQAEKSYLMEKGGKWVTVSVDGREKVVREVHIECGKTTELIVLASDLRSTSASYTVKGTLKRTDGSPVVHAALRLYSNKKAVDGITDKEGRFKLVAVQPEVYNIQCMLRDEGTAIDWHSIHSLRALPDGIFNIVYFDGIEIPDDPHRDFSLDLVLSSGRITGNLCNGITGKPISAKPLMWTVVLFSETILKRKVTCKGVGTNRIELNGIASGEYGIKIIMPGYRMKTVFPVHLIKEQEYDMGDIQLEPCGAVIPEVVDPAGNPLHASITFKGFEDRVATSGNQMRLPTGKTIYWELPLGEVTMKASASNYRPKEITVKLEPGQPLDVRIVLEPEE